MALVDSNTYIEPTAGTSLNTARSQFNNALRSLLTNFRSSSAPSTTNITASGAGIGAQDGTLFHMANANVSALYVSDSTHKKSAEVGGNFTRVGIGNRIENGIASMMANVEHYEIGELTATVSADVGLAANARLYLVKANNGTSSDFIDVGIPPTNGSVVNTMIAIGGVTGDRVNFTFDSVTTSPLNRTNAHLKVGTTTATSNIGILLGSSNVTSNVSLVKLHDTGGVAAKTGLNIFDQTENAAPIAANLICQSIITGTTIKTGTGSQFPVPVAPLIPAGSVIGWTHLTPPDGWLLCDGSAISRTKYAALFALIGTTFGSGDGSATFNLPDLQDRMMAGRGANNTVGHAGARMAASRVSTSDSTTPTLTTGTIEVSVGAKDAGGVTVINAVTSSAHTHTLTQPVLVCNYIIKT
tara:strand:+ start:289 stop:1527 length:1239 start_codon:yes stop_codon:yes gene_type:complete